MWWGWHHKRHLQCGTHIRCDKFPLPTIHEQSQFYLDEGNVHWVQKSKAILLEGVIRAIVMNCSIINVKNLDVIIQTMALSQKGHLLRHLHQLLLDTPAQPESRLFHWNKKHPSSDHDGASSTVEHISNIMFLSGQLRWKTSCLTMFIYFFLSLNNETLFNFSMWLVLPKVEIKKSFRSELWGHFCSARYFFADATM